MTGRIAKEIELLRSVFPDVEYHDAETGWVRIPRYTVQHGAWAQDVVSVCFRVPAGYPGEAPYAFAVSPPLRLASPGPTSTPGDRARSRPPAAICSISPCRSGTGSMRGPDEMTTLKLPRALKARLWRHLLQDELEQVAFLFAGVTGGDGSMVFRPKDAYLAPPEDFHFQSGHHVELAEAVRPALIKRAWDTGTALVEFHSHPTDRGPAMFSRSDLEGFEEFVPHCRWRLRGRPYLAVLVNPGGVDALAWIGAATRPAALDAIRVGWFRKIVPTGCTVGALNTTGVEHGRGTL